MGDFERSEIRFATLAVLAMFALKTWLRRNDVMHPDRESESGGKLSSKSWPGPVIC